MLVAWNFVSRRLGSLSGSNSKRHEFAEVNQPRDSWDSKHVAKHERSDGTRSIRSRRNTVW